MKRAIGGIILALVFALLFGMTAFAYGLKGAVIAWGLAIVLTIIIVFAVDMII